VRHGDGHDEGAAVELGEASCDGQPGEDGGADDDGGLLDGGLVDAALVEGGLDDGVADAVDGRVLGGDGSRLGRGDTGPGAEAAGARAGADETATAVRAAPVTSSPATVTSGSTEDACPAASTLLDGEPASRSGFLDAASEPLPRDAVRVADPWNVVNDPAEAALDPPGGGVATRRSSPGPPRSSKDMPAATSTVRQTAMPTATTPPCARLACRPTDMP
jgi:hypothetical protein